MAEIRRFTHVSSFPAFSCLSLFNVFSLYPSLTLAFSCSRFIALGSLPRGTFGVCCMGLVNHAFLPSFGFWASGQLHPLCFSFHCFFSNRSAMILLQPTSLGQLAVHLTGYGFLLE